MNGDLMLQWFKATILTYLHGERALPGVDSFSGHETEEFMEAAKANSVDMVIDHGDRSFREGAQERCSL